MSGMTKRERVFAAVRGDDVDRPPIGFWGHDFIREWSAEGLAEAMLEMVQTYDYDYLKVNPRATYYSEAWGCRYKQLNDPKQGPELEHWVLNQPSDLAEIRAVDAGAGALGEQLEALRLIADGLAGDVPFVQTVFSPLSVVGRLSQDRSIIKRWMKEAPDALRSALEAITETLAAYAKLTLEVGADGIFFPTTEWGTYDALTDQQQVPGKGRGDDADEFDDHRHSTEERERLGIDVRNVLRDGLVDRKIDPGTDIDAVTEERHNTDYGEHRLRSGVE